MDNTCTFCYALCGASELFQALSTHKPLSLTHRIYSEHALYISPQHTVGLPPMKSENKLTFPTGFERRHRQGASNQGQRSLMYIMYLHMMQLELTDQLDIITRVYRSHRKYY